MTGFPFNFRKVAPINSQADLDALVAGSKVKNCTFVFEDPKLVTVRNVAGDAVGKMQHLDEYIDPFFGSKKDDGGWFGTVNGSRVAKYPHWCHPGNITELIQTIDKKVGQIGAPVYYVRDRKTGGFYQDWTPERPNFTTVGWGSLHNGALSGISNFKPVGGFTKEPLVEVHGHPDYVKRGFTPAVVKPVLDDTGTVTALTIEKTGGPYDSRTTVTIVMSPVPEPSLTVGDPSKKTRGAKKFKRYSDAKTHLLYLIGAFNYIDNDIDDMVPDFLQNWAPLNAIPADWEIVEVIGKGEPTVKMTAEEIQTFIDRHQRLRPLAVSHGVIVKAAYAKLEAEGRLNEFPFAVVIKSPDAVAPILKQLGLGGKGATLTVKNDVSRAVMTTSMADAFAIYMALGSEGAEVIDLDKIEVAAR